MSSVQEFTNQLAELMKTRAGAPQHVAEPRTIEEAAAQPGAVPTTTLAAPTKAMELPIVKDDMDIFELAVLVGKYRSIVESGAYLHRWTESKGQRLATQDPIDLGKARMTEQELRCYNWWMTQGNRTEYNWNDKTETADVPAGKVIKYNTELAALRWMYSKDDLTMENWFWIRKNSEARAHVVWALVKILHARNDVTGGMDTDNVQGVAEYNLCAKIIGVTDTVVNDFMRKIHDALRPLQAAKNVVLARKYAMGKDIGIKKQPIGTTNRELTSIGLPAIGGVTKPSSAPRGKKRGREEFATLMELRKLKIQKAGVMLNKSTLPKINLRPLEEDIVLGPESPTYTPLSPELGPTRGREKGTDLTMLDDLPASDRRILTQAIRMGRFNELAREVLNSADGGVVLEDRMSKLEFVKTAEGTIAKDIPSDATPSEAMTLRAMNKAAERGWLDQDAYQTLLESRNLWTGLKQTEFLTDESTVREWVEEEERILDEGVVEEDAAMGEDNIE